MANTKLNLASIMSKVLRTADEYGWLAPFYDILVGPFLTPLRRDACRIVHQHGFQSVLDVGCGTGQQCIMLARLGIEVTGVDLSPAMLDIAMQKSPRGVTYFLENAARMHFSDHTFDCVIISLTLHEQHPDSRARVTAEAKRVLRAGGKLLLVDYVSPRVVPTKIGAVFVRWVEYNAGSNHYVHYRQFMLSGALDGFMHRHGLTPLYTKDYFSGTLRLALAGVAPDGV